MRDRVAEIRRDFLDQYSVRGARVAPTKRPDQTAGCPHCLAGVPPYQDGLGCYAILEFDGAGFRLRRVADAANMSVNGHAVEVLSLKSEDRFQLGELTFSYLVESTSNG